MTQPTEPIDHFSYFTEVKQAIDRKDWAGLKWLLAGGAAGAVFFSVCALLALWAFNWVQSEELTGTDLLWLIFWLAVGLALLAVGLIALFFIGIAAIMYWQMTIIFVLLGGFIGHGWGAFSGFVVSGLIALAYEKLKHW